MNLKSIPEQEQENVLAAFWAMLGELEQLADSNENNVLLRRDVTGYYQLWNRVTGTDCQPLWKTRSKKIWSRKI